ncbi:hypothetical protein C0Q70_15750 [Pomacea canaliculata]|uniref:Kinesin-like protein n=1 Tax=Pomacea canaliculata TaxID=400727 RepID=A0A2T7NVQ9_POMCA|nr:hypothetical protein C0Q70_15750 [Pomacea canaliculata]
MGNGASATPQSPSPSRASVNQSTHGAVTPTPRRQGNNFQEVQVQNSSNHSRHDLRSEAQRKADPATRQQAAVEHHRRMAAYHDQQQRHDTGRQGHGSDSLVHGASRHSGRSHRDASNGGQRQPQANNTSGLQPDQVVFETFTNREGKEFICAYRNGKRYYLDSWHSQEWQAFPERWYKEGTLRPLDEDQIQENYNSTYQQGGNGSRSSHRRDDREGILRHPKRGRVDTYLMEERRYVHFFFDKFSGNWMRLPIGWELHHPLIQNMVQHVERALPDCRDPADILAMLRVCNYNPDECIGTYLCLQGDEWLVPPKSSNEAKAMNESENQLEALKQRVKSLEMMLQDEKKQKIAVEKQLADLQENYSKLVAGAKIAQTQMEAMQTSRPKSARPKTPQVSKKQKFEEILDPKQVEKLTSSVKKLHETHALLRINVTSQVDTLRQLLEETKRSMEDIKTCDVGSAQELEEIRALYQREALQRRLLYNQDIMVTNDNAKKIFSFDKVFTSEATQEEIFKDTNPIITSCVDGYNVCLMAYGQTGSGKTFTMMGPESNPGINIRAVTELLKVCSERSETKTYTLKVSMVEIYNETVQDLLTSECKVLELHAVGNQIRIPDITEMVVESVKDVKAIMEMGDKNRSVAETKMNSTSSRSHLLLRISVSGVDKVSGAISSGVLTLCDLAGSERISKTEASGQRLVEAAAINKSLSALGQVFTALRGSQLHVPYRNSKLTQILRPCLGGDAKACLFVNISPDAKNFAETCNTLEFGSNARQVALGQAKQNIRKAPDGPDIINTISCRTYKKRMSYSLLVSYLYLFHHKSVVFCKSSVQFTVFY